MRRSTRVSRSRPLRKLFIKEKPIDTADDKPSLKHAFERDGFIVLRNYLSPDELKDMRDHLDAFLNQSDPGQVRFGAIKTLSQDPWFRDFLLSARHVELIKYLIDDKLSPDNVSWISKPKGVDRTFPHFDALGTYRTPATGASLWIALDRIDVDNGCLSYEKGSHRRSLPNVYPLPDYDESKPNIVTIEANPGDAVIHSARVVHFSRDPIDLARPRNAAVFVYWGASSRVDPKRASLLQTNADLVDIAL